MYHHRCETCRYLSYRKAKRRPEILNTKSSLITCFYRRNSGKPSSTFVWEIIYKQIERRSINLLHIFLWQVNFTTLFACLNPGCDWRKIAQSHTTILQTFFCSIQTKDPSCKISYTNLHEVWPSNKSVNKGQIFSICLGPQASKTFWGITFFALVWNANRSGGAVVSWNFTLLF